MRCATLHAAGSLDSLGIAERPVPEFAPDQILVRVRAAALNPADLVVLQGEKGARFIHARRFPITPGYDFSGVVERVGPTARGRLTGDEVFGFLPYSPKNDRGTLAEYLAVWPHEVFRKPVGVSFPEAAGAATCGMTAVQMIRLAGNVRAGRRVLVNGAAGGVGSLLVQIAKAHGAEVWATASDANHAFVRRLGADTVLDYTNLDLSTIPRRFQLVADAPDAWSYRRTEHLLRTGGAYVTTRPSLRYLRGRLSTMMSSRSCRLVAVNHNDEDFEELTRLLASRRVKVPIHASYSLEDAPEALRLLRDESIRGKVVVVVSVY